MGYITYGIKKASHSVSNSIRKMKSSPDYVRFFLEGEYTDLRESKQNFIRRKIKKPKQNLQELCEQIEQVANDHRVKGMILVIRPDLQLSIAQIQQLRDTLHNSRLKGKKIISYSYRYNTNTYYLASLADRILLQPGGEVTPLGLKTGSMFFKAALDRLGIEMQMYNVTPYKSAADAMTKTTMTEEVKKMNNWLLDSIYDEILTAISKGRKISLDEAKYAIDNSPYTDVKAKKAKIIDKVLNEEQIYSYLNETEGKKITIKNFKEAQKSLLRPAPKRAKDYIALIKVEGNIIDGKSSNPLFNFPIPILGGQKVGDITVVDQVRKAQSDKRAKAAVIYIDSGGGSATSSEAMASAIRELSKKKPVVAVMSSVAASGGYYVATAADWIIAQPSTVTGSIGVITGKVVNKKMLEKLLLNYESITRGENVEMSEGANRFSKVQEEKVKESLFRIYDVFLDRVVDGRSMLKEEVEKIAGGRVWTGKQAYEKGLVDDLGGLETALRKIYNLTSLDSTTPVKEIPFKKEQFKEPLPTTASMLNLALEDLKKLEGCNLYASPMLWVKK
ncbi:signal peptide peptidase SppA [Proteinivorax hydrogeniformans]|uniref:Signal peptide peptidase SppA n=1 Tax=Proteinivorax hydrogeniformans TaxID=1826727 RepID=A0AAU8HW50_9FIRM